ncbi:glycosyltransferase family 4 protein [Spiribacter roseus]|uniref:glycosyltransferase family 4 protein n=1 Tax=Spiribacter roseus TaxID=1855875 RepID=UPI001F346389|nr:glycosyltransferase family 4 protein [Spiribacter roseus]
MAYYLPGCRSGGPVRTIANFVDHLGDEFDIRIVTRDRDALDTEPYRDVGVDEWNTVGKAQVLYASDQALTLRGIARLLRETPHDILYLNSFFSFRFTTLPLLAERLGMASRRPCVVAPRGEFSPGAIGLKAWKKRSFLALARLFGLYSKVRWQASSENEAKDISRALDKTASDIIISQNLPPKLNGDPPTELAPSPRAPGPLRVVFLSRITPKKNLDFAIRILEQVSTPMTFDIYGSLSDLKYWEDCRNALDRLPPNIWWEYKGAVDHAQVSVCLKAYDLFFLPTLGENYGHVIAESLWVGTPVLISDQTPWRELESNGAGWSVPIHSENEYVSVIHRVASMQPAEHARARKAARLFAYEKLVMNCPLESNRDVFALSRPTS